MFKIKKACLPMRRGITVIELLVVLAVLGIIFAVALPQFSKIRENQVLKSGVQDILSSIDKARSQTLASLNLNICSTCGNYGVHFQSDKVIIFRGVVFSASDVNNESIDIITPASITNFTFVEGNMYFNRLTGSPSATGTVTISTTNYSKIITIWATGVVSVD